MQAKVFTKAHLNFASYYTKRIAKLSYHRHLKEFEPAKLALLLLAFGKDKHNQQSLC